MGVLKSVIAFLLIGISQGGYNIYSLKDKVIEASLCEFAVELNKTCDFRENDFVLVTLKPDQYGVFVQFEFWRNDFPNLSGMEVGFIENPYCNVLIIVTEDNLGLITEVGTREVILPLNNGNEERIEDDSQSVQNFFLLQGQKKDFHQWINPCQ